MEQIRSRILNLLSEKGLNVSRASVVLQIPQRTLNRQLNEGGSVSMELIRAISRHFPEVSIDWILNGNDNMHVLCSGTNNYPQNVSPYYNSITVSAGVRDAMSDDCELSDSFVYIPGVKADFFFPVVGTSMQPEINPGDIVGVKKRDTFAELDESRVYMIVTRDSRIIKHCCAHREDNEIIVCSSPNYPSFNLRKEDIIAIYDVVVIISNI